MPTPQKEQDPSRTRAQRARKACEAIVPRRLQRHERRVSSRCCARSAASRRCSSASSRTRCSSARSTSAGIAALDPYLEGPTGVVFSPVSEVAPAKILADFAKENEKPRDQGGGAWTAGCSTTKAIAELATLPSREVLLSQVLGTIIAPMTSFLGAIDATLRLPAIMADVLEAREEQGGPDGTTRAARPVRPRPGSGHEDPRNRRRRSKPCPPRSTRCST